MVFILATIATVSLGADKAVEFITAEAAHGDDVPTPTWIEWDGRELTLHPTLTSVTLDTDLSRIPTFEATYEYLFDRLAGTPLGAELANVSLNRRSRAIVLLVRPSGFSTLPEIRGYLDLLGIQVVDEPIDQGWRRVRVR